MNNDILNVVYLCKNFLLMPPRFFFYKVLFKLFLFFNIKKNVCFVLLNSDEMIFLNKKYKNNNCVTDILSFSNNLNYKNIKKEFLGDIILCPLEIYYRSILKKINYLVYFSYLLIHGLLHLLNFDHKNFSDYKIMFFLEKYFMKKFWNINNFKFI